MPRLMIATSTSLLLAAWMLPALAPTSQNCSGLPGCKV